MCTSVIVIKITNVIEKKGVLIIKYLLQVDFPMDVPFGEEMSEAFVDLAKSINEEPGMIWKIWTENAATKEAGGVYLFETKTDAEKYLTMHSERLASFGITDIRVKIFEVNEVLSTINNAPIK
ncbi:UNVERIFIED_CONTAM: putative monooxygenase ydhR [Lysinibacillus xylanilyticus]